MRHSAWRQERKPFDEDPEMAKHLAELEELHRDWSEKGEGPTKDAAARKALGLAGSIFRTTAGWALHHRKNQAENDLRPSDSPGLPDPHSRLGYVEAGPLTSVQSRRFVRDLLMTIGDYLFVQNDFIEALEALDHGEVLPPVEAVTRNRIGLTELQARLTALCYIEYLSGKGMKKSVTSIEVADLFNVNPESMKDWRADLTKRLGKPLVDGRLRQARVDGEEYRKHNRASELDWTVRDVCEETHGMEVLQRAAETYKRRGQ